MTHSENGPQDWLQVRVASRWREAADIAVLELVPAGPHALPAFEAGAFIDVLTPAGHLRPYSLCNAPSDHRRYVIAILRDGQGQGGSVDLHDGVGTGAILRIRPPRNEFSLQKHAVHSLLLAGGIGITPLLSMAHHLWQRGAPFALRYCARSPERAAFVSALRAAPFAGQVRFHWSEEAGRVSLDTLVRAAPISTHFYACGPRGFLRDAQAAFVAAGRDASCWHEERFSAQPLAWRR